MSDNVMWVGKDGWWKTGVKVNIQGYIRRQLMPESRGCSILVQHSYTNELEFVEESKLKLWPIRTERGEEPYGTTGYLELNEEDKKEILRQRNELKKNTEGKPTTAYVNQDGLTYKTPWADGVRTINRHEKEILILQTQVDQQREKLSMLIKRLQLEFDHLDFSEFTTQDSQTSPGTPSSDQPPASAF